MRFSDFSRKGLMIGIVVVLIALCLPCGLPAYDFSGWSRGASGHEEALKEAMNEGKPLIVYFWADWCKWCRRLNSQYLASSEVERFLSEIPRVQIEPDKGSAEKELSRKHGVTGYPTFLVSVPSLGKGPGDRLHPFRGGKELSVKEFLREMQTAIARKYTDKAYASYKSKNYDEAVDYYGAAIAYDEENAYAYYGLGAVYYAMAYQKKDVDLLKEAEGYWERALEIDPKHAASKAELERLRRAMKELGAK